MIANVCKHYRSSKCLLKDKFCDLNCNHMFFEDDGELSREDSLARLQAASKESERAWAKYR
jgi:hypothetical protein